MLSLLLVAPLAAMAAAEEKAKTTKVSGVAVVDGTTLIVAIPKAKGAPFEPKAIEIGPTTKVQVETAEDVTTKDEKGKEVKRPKVADGALTDLTTGKRVTVTVAEDGKKAVSVLVQREHAKKKGKKGK